MKLRVGVHPNNLHLMLANRWGQTFDGLEVTYRGYDDGRETGQRIAAGEIDVGGTGSTPPILDQARGLDVRYLAASAPRPENGAVVVAANASIDDMRGLAGCRVGLLDGSFHTYLLARVLEDAGLSIGDVVRVELPPIAARRALADGSIDAWVAMAPLLDAALMANEIRILARCGEIIPNRSVFWTLEQLRFAPEIAHRFVAGLRALGERIAADPAQAAELLGGPDATAETRARWLAAVSRRDWRIIPVDAAILSEQHTEAAVLRRHGVLASVP